MFLGAGEGFNPIEHLYDRYTVWVSYWGAHGDKLLELWNGPLRGTSFEFLMISQHVLMIWAAAAIMLGGFCWATYVRNTRVPRGLRNFLEPIVTFIRDDVVRPNISNPHEHGHGEDAHAHDGGHTPGHKERPPYWLADKFVPYFVCLFCFIALVNLLGLIPGSTTSSSAISFTGALAALTLGIYLVGAFWMSVQRRASVAGGIFGFFVDLVPYKWSLNPMDMAIWVLLFFIELLGFLLIKPVALAVRLFANMTGGHCSLLSFLFINLLIPDTAAVWRLATGLPTVGIGVALYGLEIFVSILQAYIFTLLSAIFVGLYLVPEH